MFIYSCICRNRLVSCRYDTAVGIWPPSNCVFDRYMHVYVCIYRNMHLYACICIYNFSICMYCMYWSTGTQKPPQRPQNILLWPITPGNPLRATQGMCLTTFRPHPPPPPPPDFVIFSSRISVWTCFATALESARTLWRCHNFAQSASHDVCTGHNCMYSNQTFIYGWRMHQRCPTQEVLCLGPSCHSCRIVQNRPGRLKLGLTALPRALYRVHKLCWNRRVIITVLVHQRMPSCSIFNMHSYGSTEVKCTTNQTHSSVTDGY